ncbi:prophage tail fiber N-terminal domain-containing protein [Citrobacter sp. Ca226]|nr:prophage tail fiber N-terminal domain-containing protein [Citrobacter sp. Ca226]MDM3524040.1 prophage tail fiber N-terminal domain-containing protein [Citrobacter sp. Ca226]
MWEDSVAGALNDFLGTVTENDVRPEALKRFEAMVDEVSRLAADVSMNTTQSEQSARFASASAKAAAASVHRDRWVQPVRRVTREIKATSVHRDRWVQPVRRVTREIKATLVHRDRWVQPVQKETKETKVQREQQVRRGQRERQREL